MDDPWVEDDRMTAEQEASVNMVTAFVRFMERTGCCEDCIAKVRSSYDVATGRPA